MPRKLTIRTTCPNCGGDVWSRPGALHAYCSVRCGLQAQNRKPRPSGDPTTRFWSHVRKSDSCWLVDNVHHLFGYGVMSVPRPEGGWKNEGMHRIAWWVATGQWPEKGQQVCHDCPGGDNPACVRNDGISVHAVGGVEYEKRGHLWLGNAGANHHDKIEKGRAPVGATHRARIDPSYLVRGDRHPARIDPSYLPRGENHVNSKATDTAVREIRRRHALGGVTQKALADEFGLSQSLVGQIVKRRIWRHIE
jgi:hypothetical protein